MQAIFNSTLQIFRALLLFLLGAISAHASEPSKEPILRIELGMHTANIARTATDNDGRWLVTASHDKTARIWDLHNGALLTTLRIPISPGDEGKIFSVALSPDGKIVAVGGYSKFGDGETTHNLFIFERATGHMLQRLKGLSNSVLDLAFSPDGSTLGVAMGSGGMLLFSVADWSRLGDDHYADACYSIHFNPSLDARLTHEIQLVTTSLDGYLRVYSYVDEAILKMLVQRKVSGGKQPITARFSPDGKQIAVGFADTPAVRVFKASDLSISFALDTTDADGEFHQVAWSKNGAVLYAAGSAAKEIDGVWLRYIRTWPNGGKGNAVDWLVAQSSIMNLTALSEGRLVFSSGLPDWGVFKADGTQTLTHSKVVADFRGLDDGLTISPDGSRVGFGFDYKGQSTAVFDISGRGYLTSETTGLLAPVTNSPESGINISYGSDVNNWNDRAAPQLNSLPIELLPHETSLSQAVLRRNNSFVLGTEWRLIAYDKIGQSLWAQPSPGEVWSVNASTDGRYIVAAYGDGTIRWHRASDGVEQLAFFPHADKKRWIMWTPEGYYDASPGGEELIGWHLNQGKDKEARFIPSSQLYDVFFRPDIVQAKFRGDDISSLITITAAQALKFPPPILSFTKAPSSTKNNMEQVCYKAVATGGGIGEVRLFQNGKLIKSDGFYREGVAKVGGGEAHVKLASIDSAAVTRALKLTKTVQQTDVQLATNSKGNEYTECQQVETIPGDNEISVTAFNANNTIQSSLETMHFTADRAAEEPHLYVLGVGIDRYTASENNLAYAVKDATDFRTAIQAKAKGLYKDSHIHIEGLSNAQATKAGIQQALSALSAKVKPWDSFILFVASHGHLQDNQYYIVTSDFDGAIDTSKMISSNEIVGMSKNIKSLSQLLIFDTCHAGGVDNIVGGLYDARMSVMAKKMGLHIYASAGGTQTALDGYKGNGLFTHALLKSMSAGTTTDSNHDKEVSVAELGESAKQETMTISKQLGFPQSPNIINFGKDNAVFGVK